MKIIEIPENLTKQEKINFLNNQKKIKKDKKIDRTRLVGETKYFLIFRDNDIIKVESKEYKTFNDFSEIEKNDLNDAYDIVNIISKKININKPLKYIITQNIDFFQCIIKK